MGITTVTEAIRPIIRVTCRRCMLLRRRSTDPAPCNGSWERIITTPPRPRAPRRNERAADDDPPSSQRATNAAATTRGWKFIGYGDENFKSRRYSEANQRYHKAITTAPALAEGYFRAGFALLALGHWEPAAQVFKRGLNVDPNWAQSRFHLDDLYGANPSEKAAHLESWPSRHGRPQQRRSAFPCRPGSSTSTARKTGPGPSSSGPTNSSTATTPTSGASWPAQTRRRRSSQRKTGPIGSSKRLRRCLA